MKKLLQDEANTTEISDLHLGNALFDFSLSNDTSLELGERSEVKVFVCVFMCVCMCLGRKGGNT